MRCAPPLQLVRVDLDRFGRPGCEISAEELRYRLGRRIDETLATFDRIMLLFRLEADRDAPPVRTTVDLSARLDGLVEDMEPQLEQADRCLETRIESGVEVAGDGRLIDSLCLNLLENAAKYAPGNAVIRVSLDHTIHGFRLKIGNSGGGFPADVRASAFDQYARAGAAETASGAGIGLGLVRRIAVRHGFSASITPSQTDAEVVIEGPTIPVSAARSAS